MNAKLIVLHSPPSSLLAYERMCAFEYECAYHKYSIRRRHRRLVVDARVDSGEFLAGANVVTHTNNYANDVNHTARPPRKSGHRVCAYATQFLLHFMTI